MVMDNRQTERWLADHRSKWRYWRPQLWLDSELTPLRISLAYLVLGMGALVLSDVLFPQYLSDPFLSQVQAIKGGVEVFLTAGFILVLTAWREAQLQRHIDRLDQQHEQLQVLHRVLRHNLRNDLNIIHGYIKRIHERLENSRNDSECEEIIEVAERMRRYTEQATRIRRITDGDQLIQTYDLAEMVSPIIADHPQVTSDVEISISVPDSAVVLVNHMFESALQEVLTNAIKHNEADVPRIRIEVLPECGSQDMIEISVRDNGPGIPNEELEPIQDGEDDPLVHLSGLGLWFVAWTVNQSGGELYFEESEHGGTTVRMRVPKALE